MFSLVEPRIGAAAIFFGHLDIFFFFG
jgi:hypothetical protein